MSAIHIHAQLSSEQLLDALDQMPQAEFEQFADQVLALRLRRTPTVLSANESDVLLKINQSLPIGLQQHSHELIAQRDAASLTPEEHTELLQLTDQAERVDKAEGNLVTAQREVRVRKAPNYDAACFPAQQCAEKYLKARLQEASIVIPYTHIHISCSPLPWPLSGCL